MFLTATSSCAVFRESKNSSKELNNRFNREIINNFTKALSKDLASDNILVNTVCIGLVKSGQHDRRYEALDKEEYNLTLDEYYEQLGQRVPIGRVAESEEAGDVIAFLASERASYLTGIAINIDGGTSAVL